MKGKVVKRRRKPKILKDGSRSETDIQDAILHYLSHQPGFYWRQKTVGTYSPKCEKFLLNPANMTGVSDIIGIYPNGRFIAIEVKRPENKIRPDHQIAFLDKINKNGGVGIFATSVDDVIELFEELKKGG